MGDTKVEKTVCETEEKADFSDTFVDDDMFDLESPSELSPPLHQENPVEDHLIQQLAVVEDQLKRTGNDILDIRDTARRILKCLEKTLTGEYENSDSDSDLHTVAGEPSTEKKSNAAPSNALGLDLINRWQRVIGDKWIVGATLKNMSNADLGNPKLFIHIKGMEVTQGKSIFWRKNQFYWQTVGIIEAKATVVAVTIVDLPFFSHSNFIEFDGLMLYTQKERVLQLVLPRHRLHAMDTINSLAVNFTEARNESILAIKSFSIQRILTFNGADAKHRVVSLTKRFCFTEVAPCVYVVKETGSLHLCLIEIFPTVSLDTSVNIRLSTRSQRQLHLVLQLMQDDFPDIVIDREECIRRRAIKAILEELDALLANKSFSELQRKSIYTDLVVP